MKIGIFETDHFEVAYSVIRLFDNGKNDITIFVHETSKRQLEFLLGDRMLSYTWVVKKTDESHLQFISRLYKFAKHARFDILYLATVSNNHLVFATLIVLLRKTRIIVTLHDINSHFAAAPTGALRTWVRYFGKRAVIKVTREFNVISSTMTDYLQSKLPAGKKVHSIPGGIFEEAKRNTLGPNQPPVQLKVVVPGTIDNRRRNYDDVFDLLEEINRMNLPISIILLGGINEYGKDILEKCKQYVSKVSNLIFFQTDIIDQPIFDREMAQAHFVWIPSVINTIISDGITETYGRSISSGTVFDVIRQGKPCIAPHEMAIPQEIESSCFRYKSIAEILPFLSAFLTDPDQYDDWKKTAVENSREFTIEKIRRQNPGIFMQD